MKTPLWLALLMVALAIPLMLQKVPLNGYYGLRIPKTMSSPEIWYKANRIAGIGLFCAGVLTLIVWGVLRIFVSATRADFISMPYSVVACWQHWPYRRSSSKDVSEFFLK